MKVTPEWRVYILGVTLCVALTICSRYFGDRGGPYFMASLTVAGIAYLLAIRELFATPEFEQRVPGVFSSLGSCWLRCGTLNFFGCPRAPMMISIAMFGTAACKGSATTLILSFPAILPLATAYSGNPQLEQPGSAKPVSSRSAAFFPRSHCDSGVHLCTESGICGLRVRNCFRVTRCLASYRARERTWFWRSPGTHCWPLRWREAVTLILLARYCWWCPSLR